MAHVEVKLVWLGPERSRPAAQQDGSVSHLMGEDVAVPTTNAALTGPAASEAWAVERVDGCSSTKASQQRRRALVTRPWTKAPPGSIQTTFSRAWKHGGTNKRIPQFQHLMWFL